MTVVDVAPAYLTPVRRGSLRVLERPNRWMRGAVHDGDGRLVRESQKIGGLGGGQIAQADPDRTPVRADARRLPGTWLYGGHFMRHFGHFITETLSTLWPIELLEQHDVRGLVFHAYFADTPEDVADWQQQLLDLAGYAGLPVHVVHRLPLATDRLLVPTRAVTLNGWAHPEAVTVWQRAASAAGRADGPDRVFLSRSEFNRRGGSGRQPLRTDAEWDEALDAAFADAGFAIVHPEQLPVVEQVRLAAGAEILAGASGSALHLSIFGPSDQRVIELGDRRSPDEPVPMQLALDAACGHERSFLAHGSAEDVPPALAALGLHDIAGPEGDQE